MPGINLRDLDLAGKCASLHLMSTRTRAQVYVVIILLMIAATAWFYWWPKYEEAKRLEYTVVEKLEHLDKQAKVINQRVEIEKDLQVLRLQIPTLIAGFPDKNQLPALLERIYSELQAQGMQLLKFKPLAPEPGQVLTRVPVEVTVQGSSVGVTSIPNILAGLSRKVNLGDFLIRAGESKTSQWTFDGRIDAYIQMGPSVDPAKQDLLVKVSDTQQEGQQ